MAVFNSAHVDFFLISSNKALIDLRIPRPSIKLTTLPISDTFRRLIMLHPETIIWADVVKKRNGYFVKYTPPRYAPDNAGYPLANLQVTFVLDFSTENIAEILESEFEEWAKLYPVFLMATAWDNAENVVDLSGTRNGDHLTGYYSVGSKQIVLQWGLMDESAIPHEIKDNDRLKNIYAELPYKIGQDVTKFANEKYKKIAIGNKIILSALAFWLLVPIAIEVWGIANPVISNLIFVYSLSKAGIALFRLLGKIKPSAKDVAKMEKTRRMEHYFYHCERNPVGFNRLKVENFEAESKDRVKKQMDELL